MAKKIISLLLAALMALSFTACSGDSDKITQDNVTATVESATKALKDFDIDGLEKYVDSSTLTYIIGLAKNHTQFADLGRSLFENLTVEVKSVDLEAKTVTVSVMNKELGETAAAFAKEITTNYNTAQLLTQLNDEQWLNENLKNLTDGIAGDKMAEAPTEVTLSIKQNDGHLTLVYDDAAEDAVSGGALKAIKEII